MTLWPFVAHIKAQEGSALMSSFTRRAFHGSGPFFPVLVFLGLSCLQRPRGTRIEPHLGCQTVSQQGSEDFLRNEQRSSCVFRGALQPVFVRLTHFSGKHQAVSVDCISLLRRTHECKQTEQWGLISRRAKPGLNF